MGGTAWCCLLVIAKNPQIPVASWLGGSLGLVQGGRLPPSLGGPARTQFRGLWSPELY